MNKNRKQTSNRKLHRSPPLLPDRIQKEFGAATEKLGRTPSVIELATHLGILPTTLYARIRVLKDRGVQLPDFRINGRRHAGPTTGALAAPTSSAPKLAALPAAPAAQRVLALSDLDVAVQAIVARLQRPENGHIESLVINRNGTVTARVQRVEEYRVNTNTGG